MPGPLPYASTYVAAGNMPLLMPSHVCLLLHRALSERTIGGFGALCRSNDWERLNAQRAPNLIRAVTAAGRINITRAQARQFDVNPFVSLFVSRCAPSEQRDQLAVLCEGRRSAVKTQHNSSTINRLYARNRSERTSFARALQKGGVIYQDGNYSNQG